MSYKVPEANFTEVEVFFLDSVLSSADVPNGVKRYSRKDGRHWICLPPPMPFNEFHALNTGGHGTKVIVAAMSGWAFEDGIPRAAMDFVRREAGGGNRL